jgi:hypothetical protein
VMAASGAANRGRDVSPPTRVTSLSRRRLGPGMLGPCGLWLAAVAADNRPAAANTGYTLVQVVSAKMRHSRHMSVKLDLVDRAGWPRASPAVYFNTC